MNLIKVGDRILNMDNVTHLFKGPSDMVTLCFAASGGESAHSIDVDGNPGQRLWAFLTAKCLQQF